MRKLKNLLNRIPRPLKACVCSILVILLAVAYYIALGCPTTFRQEFRRAEKVHLVGPSTIVDIMNGEYTDFDRIIVGETEHGICFFGEYTYNNGNTGKEETDHYFSYLKKTGNITFAAAPNSSGIHWDFVGFRRSHPVYLFVEDPNAVRAEIQIKIKGLYDDRRYTEVFLADAIRLESNVFRFIMDAESKTRLNALFCLSTISGGNVWGFPASELSECTATVRLYDSSGQLITEETLAIHAPASSN